MLQELPRVVERRPCGLTISGSPVPSSRTIVEVRRCFRHQAVNTASWTKTKPVYSHSIPPRAGNTQDSFFDTTKIMSPHCFQVIGAVRMGPRSPPFQIYVARHFPCSRSRCRRKNAHCACSAHVDDVCGNTHMRNPGMYLGCPLTTTCRPKSAAPSCEIHE